MSISFTPLQLQRLTFCRADLSTNFLSPQKSPKTWLSKMLQVGQNSNLAGHLKWLYIDIFDRKDKVCPNVIRFRPRL